MYYFSNSGITGSTPFTPTDTIKFTILSITSDATYQYLKCQPQKVVPTYFQTQAGGWQIWARAVATIGGMTQLVGQTVTILADGNVEPQQVVPVSGIITLTRPAAVVHVGLPIVAQMQTLDLEDPKGETLSAKKKRISEVGLWVVNSRGGYVGQTQNALVNQFQRVTSDPYDTATSLKTGLYRVPVQGDWAKTTSVFIQQTDPLPLTISALVVSGELGG